VDANNNHYAFLGLEPFASVEDVAAAVERVSKQANALANTNPARSQELREELRQIRYDLLTTDERRYTYDNALLDAIGQRSVDVESAVTSRWAESGSISAASQPAAGGRSVNGLPMQHPSPSTVNRRGRLWIAAGIGLAILAAGGGGYAIASGALRSTVAGPASTATTLPSPTSAATVTSTATPRPTSTPKPQHAVVKLSTPVPQDTVPPPPISGTQLVTQDVADYINARDAAYGPNHDTSGLDSTVSSTALSAIMCTLQNKSDSLKNTHAYFTYTPVRLGNARVSVTGNTATVTQFKEEVRTLHKSDGTIDASQDSYTVTYSLSRASGSWKVVDYNWVTPGGASGGASVDAGTCR
jgi:ARC6-like, IMS domain